MDIFFSYFVWFFVGINLLAFLIMFIDKKKAKKAGKQRISEGIMFFMATMFGSAGVYVGILTFRHKTKKWYFIVGIPFLIVQNVALLWVVYSFLK